MRKQTKLWTTKNGQKIRICDMDDSHLLNSIKLVRKKAANAHTHMLINTYGLLSVTSGDAAEWSLESEISRLEKMPLEDFTFEAFPILEALESERERREIA